MKPPPLWVIKVGGSQLEPGPVLQNTAASIAATVAGGVRVVVVHGGGVQIERWSRALGLPQGKVDGLRVTDEATAEVVQAVLAGVQGKNLAAALHHEGCEAVSLCGADAGILTARVSRAGTLGRVGEVETVRTGLITALLARGHVPLIAPLGLPQDFSPEASGSLLNINADSAAGPLAQALTADALLMLTDVSGVLDEHRHCIKQLDRDRLAALRAQGNISAGMIPKVQAALATAEALPHATVRIAAPPQAGASLQTVMAASSGTLINAMGVHPHV